MQIPEILKSMLRTPGENVAVDVAVGQLRPLEEGDNFVDARLDRVIPRLLNARRGGLQPFGKVGIPKDAASPVSRIGPGVGTILKEEVRIKK